MRESASESFDAKPTARERDRETQSGHAVDRSPAADALALVVADDAAVGEAQGEHTIALRPFLSSLRPFLERAVDATSASTGRTADDCPWIGYYLDHFASRSVDHFRAVTRRWLRDRRPRSIAELRRAIAERVAEGTRAWASTGRAPALPPDVPRPGPAELARYAASGAAAWLHGWTSAMFRSALPGAPAEVPTRARVAIADLGPGAPVDAGVRRRAETSFGVALDHVRAHTDGAGGRVADAAGARAVAFGDHIAFAAGRYRPGTVAGDLLIAHELAHAAQQHVSGDRTDSVTGGAGGADAERDADRHADRAALAAVQGKPAHPGSAGGLRFQRCSVDEVEDPMTAEEHEPLADMSPEDYIRRYTTPLGDLDEDGLGDLLARMAWYTPAHHAFIRRIFDALRWEDRDDVAAAMVAKTQDSDLADLARSEDGRALLAYMVPELREGWESGGETFAAVRILRALRAREAAGEAAQEELATLERVVAETETPPEVESPTLLGDAELSRRLRLIDVQLDRIEERWSNDEAIGDAVRSVRERLAAARTSLSDDAARLSRRVPEAQVIVETSEQVLTTLDEQAHELRRELRRRGTEEANLRLIAFVRERFVLALGAALGDDATRRFAQAGAALSQLPRSQTAIDLEVMRRRPSLFEDVNAEVQRMSQFAGWLQGEIRGLEAEAAEIEEARQAGEDVDDRREELANTYQVLSQSLRVLGAWETSIQVAEALESGFSFTEGLYSDIDIGDIHGRLHAMAALARAGDLEALRQRIDAFEGDDEIQDYYEDVPAILRSSGIVVAIGVTLVAAAVTWGIGALVAAPAAGGGAVAGGVAAGGTTTTVTAGSIATGVATVAAEALVFTTVHRGLSELVGIGARGTFVEDFLWNFGLFGVLRVVGFTAKWRGWSGTARTGVTFGALEAYGTIRFGVEEGRWPTAGEFAELTAHNIVIMAAFAGMHATVSRLSPIGRLNARYGARFRAIENERQALARDAEAALREGRTEDIDGPLRARGEALEARLQRLIDRVIADRAVNVNALLTQLQAIDAMVVSQRALSLSLRMPAEVALERAGGEFSYSYRHGETARVAEGARGLGAEEVHVREAAREATVIEARFPDRPPMMFVERAITYEQLGRQRGLPEEVLEVIRETGVDPTVAGRVLDGGVTPHQLGDIALDHGASGVRAVDNLIRAGVQPNVARHALRLARDIGAMRETIDLVNSGNLENPRGLRNFLRDVSIELTHGQTGKYQQLIEVSQRAARGHRVSFEGRRQVAGDPESGQADVVDHTAREAIQMKVVMSAAEQGVIDNVQSAVDQLGGRRGELPPTGYQRIVDARVQGPDNPLTRASRAQLLDALRGQIRNLEDLTPADTPAGEVRITNTRGSHVFSPAELR